MRTRPRRFPAKTLEKIPSVFHLMETGFAPSQIDILLKLPSGMAHDLVLVLWDRDRKRNTASIIDSFF
jgi:hypothetical protein